ncbi:MAG: hypothetical protein ACQEUM_07365 [Pseudomonadota bacterium]
MKWYELRDKDGREVIFYVKLKRLPEPGEPLNTENVWWPDGTQPQAGEKVPPFLGRNLSPENLHPCQSPPDFLR